MLWAYAKIEARNSFGKHIVSIVFTHIDSIYINEYLGLAKIENDVIIQTGYGATMQQYYGCAGAERFFPGTSNCPNKRNMSHKCYSKANLTESHRDTINASGDLREFQWKFAVDVYRADIVNAGANLFFGATR